MTFGARVVWTGNTGQGTAAYRAYSRDHEIGGEGKGARIAGSSDPAFLGDRARYSPEELLVASLAACHMLWYLHLCAEAGIVVSAYSDEPSGQMGSDRFEQVTLRPRVTITDAGRVADAAALHQQAHERCFIANSVRFPVSCEPQVTAV